MEAPLDIKVVTDILLLEDDRDEYHTTKYPLINTEPASWIAFSATWDFAEPVCYHNRVPSIIIIFHHPSFSEIFVSAQQNRNQHLIYLTTLYNQTILPKLRTKYLPLVYPIPMSDQHGPTPALYMFDLKNLSDQFYSQGMLIPLLSKQLLNPFKLFLVLWWYMMLSITSLNRWDFPSVNDDSLYLFSSRFSTFTGMFSIQFSLTITTDIWKLRRKWSKLHVIYFSVLISNWSALM